MLNILNLTKTNKLILAAFAFLAALTLGGGRAHAATLNVTGGCTLPIAIDSVNAGANQSDCTASGSYGTNDTITLPAGTITLSADLPEITKSVSISGAGMDQTTISGDNGSYTTIWAVVPYDDPIVNVSVQDLKITAFNSKALRMKNVNATLRNIEVDGQDSNALDGIVADPSTQVATSVLMENIYVHNMTAAGFVRVIAVNAEGGDIAVEANLNNITIADIHNTGAQNFTYGVQILAIGDSEVTATISNVTVDDITGEDFVAPFGSFSVGVDGASTSVNTSVNNITVTGMRGVTGTGFAADIRSAAFYAAAAVDQPSGHADVNVSVSNSLMADNLNNGVSSNCTAVDLTNAVGGSGTDVSFGITSNGFNMSDDDTCDMFIEEGDQQNISNIIPTLGPLQNNSGSVPTRALLPGSPAIAAGASVLGVTTDARGIARPNSCPSVGAFQFEGAVCGASTPSTPGSGNAGAPNTGIGAVSPAITIIATSLGLCFIVYALRKRSALK
jgi:hypothetical protein